ncbi:hypothetical protein E2C01_062990 [Portunus trituberculatus]|uniref:Uncharacterized protein n=1 Tax=Portunus trituberculatus TaxID=210409 RepID=A0A5B7H9C1_PORTR|nr:hypothetical protein [Portunus trituberculatus]
MVWCFQMHRRSWWPYYRSARGCRRRLISAASPLSSSLSLLKSGSYS